VGNNAQRTALTGVLAAMYAAAVLALAPLSFAVFQIRVANALKALAICRPEFAFAFAVGDFIANQASPFGLLDWAVMPAFDFVGARLAWKLRRIPPLAILAQSLVIAAGVATFPLGLGARLPWLPSFLSVAASTLLVITIGTLVLVPVFREVEAELR
jgi:uncharacterized membrane protein